MAESMLITCVMRRAWTHAQTSNEWPYCSFPCCVSGLVITSLYSLCLRQGRRTIDNWGGGHIHIFVFCTINFFWNRLFLVCEHKYMNIHPPPPQLSIFRRLGLRLSGYRLVITSPLANNCWTQSSSDGTCVKIDTYLDYHHCGIDKSQCQQQGKKISDCWIKIILSIVWIRKLL